MSAKVDGTPRVPPWWFVRTAWGLHRGVYSLTGGRLGLRSARADRYGMLRLTTIGRRTGKDRHAIVGYVLDGSDLVLLAMNGWAAPEPAWLLNLRGHPDARVDLSEETREVTARLANDEERPRLWATLTSLGRSIDAYAALRPRETAVVILQRRPEPQSNSV